MVKSNEKNLDMLQEAGQVIEEVESLQQGKRFNLDKSIEELVGALCDSIIAFPSPWMDTIPDNLKKEVPLARMLLLMQYNSGIIEYMTATDVEALIYLYPRSLEAPMGHDWTEIYIHLGALVCGGMGRKVPDDLKETKLSKNQLEDLEHLKRWIYERRVIHRKSRRRGEKAEEKSRKEKESPEVIQQTFDLGLESPEAGQEGA